MINVYSTESCPKCMVLKTKLKQKNIDFNEIYDIETMHEKGIQSVPWLEIDGEMLDFPAAIKWVNEV